MDSAANHPAQYVPTFVPRPAGTAMSQRFEMPNSVLSHICEKVRRRWAFAEQQDYHGASPSALVGARYPPFGAGIGVLPVETLAVQMWTFWVPTNRLGLGSPTASRIRWAACNRRDALTVQ